jgi:hypothetical protein
VIAGLVAGVLTWGGLRLAAARFLAPIVLMALLALTLELRALLGASPSSASLGRRLGVALLATAGLMGLWGVLRSDSIRALLADMARSATGRQSLSDYRSLMLGSTSELPAATEALPPSARLVAINEARRYLIHRPVELASVFDASPLRPAIAGAADGESIRRQLVIAGFTHLLVNDFERVRILNVHPPPALQGDARLTQLLALTHETPAGDAARHWAEAQLLDDYWGHTEFALDPLTNDERRAYGEFLSLMRRRALEVAAWPGQTSPAIWIAPLE